MAAQKPQSPPKKGSTKKDVLNSIVQEINKKYGDGSVITFADGPAENIPSISTGIPAIDRITGIGGLPKGRIIEIFGPEMSGKTTLALHAAAEVQRNNGVVSFIDAEHSLNTSLAVSVGVRLDDSFLITQPDNGEQALEIVKALAESCAVDLIIVDSVAAMVPKADLEGMVGESAVGIQARMMSAALRHINPVVSRTGTPIIFINQLRSKIGGMGGFNGPQETTPGGRALKFYSSMRIDVRAGKKIKKGQDTVLGHDLYVKIVKNKFAPPFRKTMVALIYGKGIARGVSLAKAALEAEIFILKGSWISYKGESLGQGVDTVGTLLENDEKLFNEVYQDLMNFESSETAAADAGPDPDEDPFSLDVADLDGDQASLDK